MPSTRQETRLFSENATAVETAANAVVVKTALETAANAVVITDTKGIILWVNPAFTALTGYSSEEVIGRTPTLLKSGKHDRQFYQNLWTTILTGKTWRGDFTNRRKDGSLYQDEHTITPVRSEEGVITHFIAIMNDVTERKRAEQQLVWKTALFEAQVYSALDGILVVDGEGRKILQNQRMIDIWNIPKQVADELDDAPELAWVTKQVKNPWQFVEKVVYLYAHPNEVSRDEIELIDGRILDRYSAPVLGKDGKYYGRIWTLRDITERHLAEITARQLAAIVASSDDAIIGKDLNSIITSWNLGAERIFGYTAEEMIGTSIIRLIPTDRQEEEREIVSRIRSGERCDHFETIRLAKDGQQLNVSITVSPIKDSTGQVVGASKVIRDITERKRTEQELNHAKEAAEAANRAKSQFLANMSHEIRTPMNGVIGMTGLLLDGELNPQQREFAEIIRASGETLLTLINDILDFSKIESGKLVFEFLDFDLVETVESTLDLLADAAHDKGIELACEIAPNVHAGLRGDAGRLRQILTNLVGNAIKFTVKGEVVVRVSIASETLTHATVRFEVEDTGIGISPAAQTGLFQPFSQADGSTTRKYGGTGLGLAISKHLVAIMEGQIGVQSEAEKGSKFWFTAKLEKQLCPVVSRETKKICDRRVLVVDDNSTNRKILHHQLLVWKMQPDCAARGEEALRMMRDAASAGKPYDLVLLDHQMPEMDGVALARAIKSDPVIRLTHLVMLTSHGQLLSPAELKELGIDSCLIKPAKQSRLFDCITDAMDRAAVQIGPPITVASTSATIPLEVSPQLEKMRILLAEDNIVNQKVALAQLHKLGYSAQAVANGLEVVKALEQGSYDVILMDCQMPELDGYEATQTIRKREQALDGPCPWKVPVRIIAMTAHVMQGELEKCLAVGMDDYICKPVRGPELQVALERWKGG